MAYGPHAALLAAEREALDIRRSEVTVLNNLVRCVWRLLTCTYARNCAKPWSHPAWVTPRLGHTQHRRFPPEPLVLLMLRCVPGVLTHFGSY
eukprot:364283-Chlamydomonas_euryale.AAC.37